MALAYNSQTFMDARNTLKDLALQRKLTQQDVSDVADAFGISPDDFKKANKAFLKAKETGDDEPNLLESIVLAPVGRAVGDAVGGLAMLGRVTAKSTLSDEAYKDLSKALNSASAYIPDSVKRATQATFDPYHGEGILGDASEITGVIGSYFIPFGVFSKAGKAAMSSKKVAPHVGVAMSKLSSKGQKFARGGAYGLAAAGASTVVEDPRNNLFDTLYTYLSGDEEAMAKLEEYEKNPADPTLTDYFSAFLKNAAIEAPIGGALSLVNIDPILKVMSKYKKTKANAKPKTTETLIGEGKPTTKGGGKLSQLFTSRRGTDDTTLARVIRREREATAAFTEADGIARDLKKLVDEELGDKIKQNPKYVSDVIDMALKGDVNAIAQLRNDSPAVLKAVTDMRNQIDNMSKELANSGVASKELAAKITKEGTEPGGQGLKTYITRSYDFFENTEAKKLIQKRVKGRIPNVKPEAAADKVVEDAAHYIANTLGKSYDDPVVQLTLEQLVKVSDKDAFAEVMENLANKYSIKSTGKPLYKRTLEAKPIRELFSEVKDPYENFTNTYQKLSVINANNKFMEEMAATLKQRFDARVEDIMANEGLARDAAILKAQQGMVSATEAGSDILGAIMGNKKLASGAIKNPLQGVYADDAYVNIVKNGLNLNPSDNKMLEGWAFAKGLSQKVKTVYNPGTHAKNVAGNAIMLTANGIIPSGKSLNDSFKLVSKTLLNQKNADLAKEMAEMDRLGIISSDVGLGEMRQNLKRMGNNFDKWFEDTTSGKRAADLSRRFGKGLDKKATEIYQMEDDFFKIVHYKNTLNYLKKANPDLPEQKLKEMAAQRTRDMMPNYNLVPTAVKKLRYLPLGNFVAFPAEMIRISKNLGTYTIKDLASNNPALQKEAAKRLAGMTVVGSAPTALSYYSMMENDITSDENEIIELTGAPYNINTEKFYLGGINRDKNGHLGVDYFNISAYDPFHYVKSIAKNTHDVIASGISPKDSEYEFNKYALAMLDQTVGPFLGVDMITEAMLDTLAAKPIKSFDEEPSMKDFLRNSLGSIINVYDPGIGRFINKRKQYEQSGMTEYFTTIPEGSTGVINYLTGFKPERADITSGMRFNFGPSFSKAARAKSQMQEQINNPNKRDPNEMYNQYIDAQKVKMDAFRDIKSMLELYQKLGYDLPEVVNDISLNNSYPVNRDKLELLTGARDNYFVPELPPIANVLVTQNKQVPYAKMNDLYSKLLGQRID